MKISVVIPTYKRKLLLKRCLESIIKQNFPNDDYEVIVVDDGASIEAFSIVEELRSVCVFLTIRYFPVAPRRGPAAARNIGWRNAKGDIIAFTDDDCIAEPAWLLSGYLAFTPDTAAVSGQIKVPIPDKPTDYQRCVSCLKTTKFTTANCFYRKRVLEKTGGFDERFTMAWREDTDLFFAVLKRNLKFTVADKAVIIHNVRRAPWGISINENKKSMYNALLFKKHPYLFRQLIEPDLPYLYYATIISAFTGIFGIFISKWFAVFIYIWIILWFWFTFKRLEDTSKSFSHVMEMFFTSCVIPFYAVFWRINGGLRFKVIYF